MSGAYDLFELWQREGVLIRAVATVATVIAPASAFVTACVGITTRDAPTPRESYATVGWEFVHIVIDDCTRLAYAEVLPNEKATTAIAFLARAVAFYERHGMHVERLLTDNGSTYRSTVHAIACRSLGIRRSANAISLEVSSNC
jgi:hypothetical protein